MNGEGYYIRDYMFVPQSKSIYQNRYFEEDTSGIHAWGRRFELCKDLNYDNTFLMIMGGILYFKEELDKANIPYINPKLQYNADSRFVYEASRNDTTYLVYAYGGDIKVMDISEFTCIDKLLYQNKEGDYLYFSPGERRLILADNEAGARKLIAAATDNNTRQESDFILKGHFSDEGDTLYFPLKENRVEKKLLKKDGKYYLANGAYIDREIKSVQIYNFSKGEFEKFEEDKYKPIGDFFYSYKGTLFAKGNVQRPVANTDSIDVEKLRPLTTEYNENGCFYTDGKVLIYVSSSQKYYNDEDFTSDRYLLLDKYIIRNVDFETLRILASDILADKDNIYCAFSAPQNETGVAVVPLNKLGIEDVKI